LRYIIIIEKQNMRGLQIVQSIFDQVLYRVQKKGEKEGGHLYLAFGELSELDYPLFKHIRKNSAKVHCSEQARLHIRLILAQISRLDFFQNYRPVETNLLPLLPITGVSVPKS
jgi:hypothetical protein